jgi:DNA invertase Pin-like site-specific DNA recombinase
MLVGYTRTSSLGLEASVAQRDQLEHALDYVREGHTLTVTKLDRLARSVCDLLNIVARLEVKKVSLRVLSMSGAEPLDTSTALGRLMLAVIGAVGQAERETMLERQPEGIAKAQREGRYEGRVPTVRRQAADILRLKADGVTPTEIARRMGIGRASVYRVLAGQTAGDPMAA